MKDKLEELICPECGHNLIDTNYNYNPKKRLTVLKLERQSSNPELMKLITKTVRLIKKNIPSEDNTRSEYFFMKRLLFLNIIVSKKHDVYEKRCFHLKTKICIRKKHVPEN